MTMSRSLSSCSFSNTATHCPGKNLLQLQQEAPVGRKGDLLRTAGRSGEWSARCLLRNLPADCARGRGNGRALPGPLRGTGTGREVKDGVVTIRYPRRLLGLGEKQGAAEVALSSPSRGGSRSRAEQQRLLPNWAGSISPGWKSKGDLTRSVWISPRPRAGFLYGSPEERQRLPCAAPQASPPASISRAGQTRWSSTIKPSALQAISRNCKVLVLIRLLRAMTSKSPVTPTESPSSLVDDGSLVPTPLINFHLCAKRYTNVPSFFTSQFCFDKALAAGMTVILFSPTNC